MASCSPEDPPELLKNPDFGAPLAGSWEEQGCLVERTEAARTISGQWCAKVTERTCASGSICQTLRDIAGGKSYYFTAWIRILTPGSHDVLCMVEMELKNGKSQTKQFATSSFLRPERDWTQIGGDFPLPKNIKNIRVFLKFEDASVSYLLDHASLIEIPVNPQWKQDALERIEKIRKQNLTITVDCGEHDPSDVEIEILLHRHHFAFGSAIQADRINGTSPTDKRYQGVFYKNFEWAVFENAMKWKQMEVKQNEMKFQRVDDALAQLKKNDITVRGHCIMWDRIDRSPAWLQPMTSAQVLEQVQRRCQYLIGRYRDSVKYWDVNNEQLHRNYFEKKTGNADVMTWMFEEAQKQDPQARLMLNDFSVVMGGLTTVAMVSSAKYLLSKGAPVHAIGLQGHSPGPVDPHLLNARLDKLAEAGLPLWITEMDVNIGDEKAKAEAYETALTVFFSRPEIQGLLVWGFWDQAHWRPKAAMWEGPDITPNAAGWKWMQLVKSDWRTHETFHPETKRQTFHIRAFQGGV